MLFSLGRTEDLEEYIHKSSDSDLLKVRWPAWKCCFETTLPHFQAHQPTHLMIILKVRWPAWKCLSLGAVA